MASMRMGFSPIASRPSARLFLQHLRALLYEASAHRPAGSGPTLSLRAPPMSFILVAFRNLTVPSQSPRPTNSEATHPSQTMATTGGNVEGYLLKLEDGTYEARVVYCILDEGIFRYFSRKGGELLGAVPLTGSKVDVFMLPYDKSSVCAHQFRVDAQPRPAVSTTKGRSAPVPTPSQLRPKVSITLAGSTKEVADQWAISILNWNRYSWDDPQTLCSSIDEYAVLNNILNPSTSLTSKLNDTFVPIGVSRAVQPL